MTNSNDFGDGGRQSQRIASSLKNNPEEENKSPSQQNTGKHASGGANTNDDNAHKPMPVKVV